MSLGSYKDLLAACRSGNLAQAKKLVAEGANLNYRDVRNEITPLMVAIEQKQTRIMDWLLWEKTVDVDRYNKHRNTALHYASRFSSDGVMVAMLGNRMERDTVNMPNVDGKTAALLAVEWDNGNPRVLQGLLSVKSVDWDTGDKNGKSLLEIARFVVFIMNLFIIHYLQQNWK